MYGCIDYMDMNEFVRESRMMSLAKTLIELNISNICADLAVGYSRLY